MMKNETFGKLRPATPVELQREIDSLRGQATRDMEQIRKIAAQRDAMENRAEGYKSALETLLGALELTLDGTVTRVDEIGRVYRQRMNGL